MAQIQIKANMEEMRKCKLFVATPMYGGQCSGMYTRSISDLTSLSHKYGIDVRFYFLFNESLITRARNYCADEFLRSDCTHLLFIDSDIGFNGNDVFGLLAIQLQNPKEYNVVAAPYPKKTISWEKIKRAVDLGYANENPFNLENFVGDFVFNPAAGQTQIRLDQPAQVREAGTGFMLIPRATFEEYDKHYPELLYKPDHVRTEHFDGSREIMAYFDCIIDPKTKRYLSEDYMFCYNCEAAGMKVWLCPWVELKHVGAYVFGGSLSAMAQIQVSPTASVESNQKYYNKKDKK